MTSNPNSNTNKIKVLTADTIIQHLEIAHKLELFKDKDDDRKAWVSYNENGYHVTHPINSSHFESWISSICYKRFRRVPGSKAIESVLRELTGRSGFSETRKVYYRIAHTKDKIYIDIGNDKYQVVEVSKDGWEILDKSPVTFCRLPGMLPLPEFDENETITEDLETLLSKFIRLDHENFVLLVSWLIGAFAKGPYPVLVLSGEQGSGKTTIARILKSIIDPNRSNIISIPRNERDLQVIAKNSWILAIDNVSSVEDWLSDALCRISTGSSYATRKLYSDNEMIYIRTMRPVIVNGIADFVGRPDLLDRSIVIELPTMESKQRRPESILWKEFHKLWPELFKAILMVLHISLQHIYDIQNNPDITFSRMADFESWVMAAEYGLTWPIGTFQDIYRDNRTESQITGVSQSRVGEAVTKFAEKMSSSKMYSWEGSATELSEKLLDQYTVFSDQHKYISNLNLNMLSRELGKIEPNLRTIGITIDRNKRIMNKRIIQITLQKTFINNYASINATGP